MTVEPEHVHAYQAVQLRGVEGRLELDMEGKGGYMLHMKERESGEGMAAQNREHVQSFRTEYTNPRMRSTKMTTSGWSDG